MDLYEKYGWRIDHNGYFLGRVSSLTPDDRKLPPEQRKEEFPRPLIILKGKEGRIKKWLVTVPILEEMPYRRNFPAYIGNLDTEEKIFRLFVDYQNWWARNKPKKAPKNAIPGSIEYAQEKLDKVKSLNSNNSSLNEKLQTDSDATMADKTAWTWPESTPRAQIPSQLFLDMEKILI